MSLIWVICGAGRGVGKTTLALQLCELLPGSVYTKCGRGKAKSDKPGKFFSNLVDLESFIEVARSSIRHVVVESNALASLSRGDIIIFIDGIAGKTHFRNNTEKLRAAANIKICRNASLADWKKALSAKVSSKTICDAVYDLLLAQKRYLFGSKPTVRSKVWFEAAGAHIFGSGLAGLLENVNRSGTLRDAAKASNMSYRYAWNLIRMAENHFGKILINRHAGGRHGGSSVLSPDGLHMLDVFKQLNEEVAVFTDKKFAELYPRGKNQCLKRKK
ncbi:MAG: winged helix-turn-helix domain-containing protein [Planctomycetota bacterium]|jgi:molybdate transport repressor ModE-like protein